MIPKINKIKNGWSLKTAQQTISCDTREETISEIKDFGFACYEAPDGFFLVNDMDIEIPLPKALEQGIEPVIETLVEKLGDVLEERAKEYSESLFWAGNWGIDSLSGQDFLSKISRWSDEAWVEFKESGDEDFQAYLNNFLRDKLMDEYDIDERYRYSARRAINSELKQLFANFGFASLDLWGVKRQDAADALEEALINDIAFRIESNDDSTPLDLLSSRIYEIRLTYLPGLRRTPYIEDCLISFNGIHNDPEAVVPDVNFLEFLDFARINPMDYYEQVLVPAFQDNPEKLHDYDAVKKTKSYSRPPVVPLTGPDSVTEIIENAYRYANVVYAAKFQIKDFILRNRDEPMEVRGGLFGLHDYINGAGHLIVLNKDVGLNLESDGRYWRPDGTMGYDIDKTYDFISKVWAAEFTQDLPNHMEHGIDFK